MLVHCAADFYQRIDQRFWRNDVAQSQRRKKNFAHRPGVNDAPEIVDPLQARERRSGKAEFRVKVVFKNKCIVSARKIEQACPALETHCYAERILMRRRYMDDFWLRLSWRSRDHNSFGVQRLRNHFTACQSKNSARLVKTGIFHPHRLARIQQRHGTDYHRLLHSADDQHLIWMTACASKIAQVRGNRFAQVRVATTRRMPQQMSALLSEDTACDPFPNTKGKFIDRRESGNQRNARPSAQGYEIKLRPCTLIWNSSYPGRDTNSTLDQAICFRSATADSFR